MAHLRQSRPDSGPDVQVKRFKLILFRAEHVSSRSFCKVRASGEGVGLAHGPPAAHPPRSCQRGSVSEQRENNFKYFNDSYLQEGTT